MARPVFRTIFGWVARQPRGWIWATTVVLIAAVSVADYVTAAEYSFTLFYLIPIALASWPLGRRAGVLISLVAVIGWLLADELSTPHYDSWLVPVWNASARLGIFLIVSLLLPALRSELERQQTLARTDAATGVVNRRGFFQRLEEELLRARRYGQPFSVAFVDLDDFKRVNDRLGHLEGDRLLQLVAGILSDSFRSTDTVARLGGDEFAVLMPETQTESARQAAEKLLQACHAGFREETTRLTLSAGVVTFLTPPPSISHALRAADRMMYEAKEAGKNTIRLGTWGLPERSWIEIA